MLGNFIAGKTSLFVVIGLLLSGTHYYSYQQGWTKGYREGVSQQNHEYDKRLADCQEQQKKVFEQEKLVLTAKLADYPQKIQTAHQTEMHYLQQVKILESHQQQLKRQLHDVTSQFIKHVA